MVGRIYDVDIITIQQPLSALLQQTDQMREILELARQKVESATAQDALEQSADV